MKEFYLVAIFDTLSEYALRITLSWVNPKVVAFMNSKKECTIKGVTFIKNDNQFIVKSKHGRVVGEIQGLSGISPRKTVIIQTKEPGLIPKIQAELTVAFDELVYVVKHFNHGAQRAMYTPFLIGHKVTDNSTQNFINGLKRPKIVSSTLTEVASYHDNYN